MSIILVIFSLLLTISFLVPLRFIPYLAKSTGLTLIVVALYALAFNDSFYVWEDTALSTLSLLFGTDVYSVALLLATGILGVVLDWNSRKPNFLLICYLAIIFSSISLDPLLALIFMEAAALFLFFYFNSYQEGREAALRFFRFSVASFCLLAVGIILAKNNASDFWPAVLIFLGLVVKLPLPPFNGWQIQSYSLGKMEGVYLLNGLLTKLPLVAVLRLPFDNGFLGAYFSVLALVAGFLAFRSDSPVRKATYLSSAHLGLFATAIFVTRDLSAQTFFWFCIAHSIASPILLALTRNEIKPNLEYLYIFFILLGAPLTPGIWADFFIFASIFPKSVTLGVVCSAALLLGLATALQLWPREREFKASITKFGLLATMLITLSLLANLAPAHQTEIPTRLRHYQINSSL